MLEIKKLTINFSKPVLNDVTFVAHSGEITSIVGPSGSGKTSLLRFIIGELKDQKGELYYNNSEITDENRDEFLFNVVTYIDQFSSFFPNMSIYDHFKFYSKLHKIKMKRKEIRQYLNKVKLDNISLWKSPSKLSTGERKRFLIAIALMLKKDIIILDEPTASLDNANIQLLMDIIKELSNENIAFIISTHNHDILDICDVIYTIEDCELNTTVNNIRKNNVKTKEFVRPRRINYSQYKNLRLRLLFVFIILLGGISIAYLSGMVSQNIMYQLSLNKDIEPYKNDRLFLYKTTDEKVVLDNTWSHQFEPYLDVLTQEEKDEIMKIEGVKEIRYDLSLKLGTSVVFFEKDPNRSLHYIYIYKDGNVLDKIEMYNEDYSPTGAWSVIGYYPDDDIKVNGKSIDGIYISQSMADTLNLTTYEDIELELRTHITCDFEYAQWDTMTVMDSKGYIQKIKYPISGIFTPEDYIVSNHFNYCSIMLVPIEQLKQLINDAGIYRFSDDEFQYISRQYIIICEEGKDTDVMVAIDEMSDRYYVGNTTLSNNEIIDFYSQQLSSSLILNVLMALLLVSSEAFLISYYIKIRTNEFMLLSREGLSKKITSYLRQDDVKLFIGWIVVSVIAFYFYFISVYAAQYSTGVSYLYISNEKFFTYWIIISIICSIVLLFIKSNIVKRRTRHD